MSPLDETRARRYLLGQMSEDEMAALETEYFASSDALEQVWGVENDLVDAFVAGQLGSEDRAAFESHYLASPLHRDRVATARSLGAATQAPVSAAPRRRIPTWSVWLTLAATIVLVLTSLWRRERPQAPTGPVAQVEPTAAATAPAPVAAPAGADGGRGRSGELLQPSFARKRAVATFALSPMLLRGGQPTPTVRVPPGTKELAIELQGELPEGTAAGTRLRFGVTTVEGARVAAGHVQMATDGLGVARIPAARLPPGDYVLSVRSEGSADGPLRQYFFRVLP